MIPRLDAVVGRRSFRVRRTPRGRRSVWIARFTFTADDYTEADVDISYACIRFPPRTREYKEIRYILLILQFKYYVSLLFFFFFVDMFQVH